MEALLAGYLRRQTEAHAAGLAAAEAGGEVVPYEAGPVQPIDARTAWEEATAAVRFFTPARAPRGWQPPPHWPTLVAAHEPAASLAFSLGNFPQLVRDLHLVLQVPGPREQRTDVIRPAAAPLLAGWTAEAGRQGRYPDVLLGLGALRLARLFEEAGDVFQAHEGDVPAEWRPVWENEKAALAWHRGAEEEARQLWLAQAASVPVLFNRGMSALFLDLGREARPALTEVVKAIPESSAWHHLTQLYLTLAETRG
jgi:hypothetical protein